MSSLKSTIRAVLPEGLYDILRRAKQTHMTRSFAAYDVENRYGGSVFKMHIADPVGEQWYAHAWEPVAEIEFLKRFDLTGGTVFDIGAHQCLIAMMLAEQVGDAGRVVAVEANAHNHAVAERNLALNGRDNVTCLRALVSSGKIAVSVDGGLNARARAGGSGGAAVDVLTIDQMTERYGAPSLIFVDIEGHEIEALAGATHTLANTRCHWFIELHGNDLLATYGHSNPDVFRFFDEERFVFYKLEEGASDFVPLTRSDLPSTRCHVFFERRQA